MRHEMLNIAVMRTGKRTTLFLSILALLGILPALAQDLPIGGWRMHLPYKKCELITGSASSIWAATDNGLFRLNRADNALERITKIEGLSDLTITAISYNAYNNTLVVGYDNGNVDLVQGKTIVNLPDIKRAQIIGSKAINNVYFVGAVAYVSTGFGIVVLDTDRKEVKDTYLIGPNGNYLSVYDITSDGTTLYAATRSGIYYAPINDPYLSNYATWSKFLNIPFSRSNSIFSNIVLFENNLLVSYEPVYPDIVWGGGEVYKYDLVTLSWDTFHFWRSGHNMKDAYVDGNSLYMVDNLVIFKYDNITDTSPDAYYLIDGTNSIWPKTVFVSNNEIWEADERYGLVKMINQFAGQSYYPNGPISTNSYWMVQQENKLLVVPGGHDDAWNNVLNKEGVSTFQNGTWSNFSGVDIPQLDTCYDLLSAAIDPSDADHYFLASWSKGLIEINNGAYVTAWDNSNSTLESKIEYQWVGIGGMQYDEDNNLWVTNSHAVTALNVYKPNGSWQAFDFTGLIPIGTTVSELLITESGQKWMILPRGGGLLVFDDKGTLTNTADDSKKRLGFTAGNGKIPGTEIYCLAEDQDGEIWVGTDKGIGVFYCAENVFASGGCDAQQILIEQDGYYQILLESQVVTCIAVDGANRKWIGTEGGGVFLMSPDGTTELAHFDASNSPLLSDNITSLSINHKTGEVFIGTSKGIVSYQGDAIEGGEHMGDVFAFPNPVKPDYSGPIAIRGLVKDAKVKITDINGRVIYETTSLGGQAIWDGNNFQGERAATGVYLVFVLNEDATEKAVTKILLVN